MEYIELSELCTPHTKNIAVKDVANQKGKYPVFGAAGLVGFMDSYQMPNEYVGIIKDGAGIGRTNTYPAKSSLIGTMQCLLPKDGVNVKYLMYLVRSLKLGSSYSGATIPHIYYKNYKNTKIPKRELQQQLEIANILDNIEQGIKVKQEQLKALDELLQSRFTEMFGRQTFEVKPIRVLVSDNIKTTKKVFTKDDEIEYIDISSIDNTQNTITGTTKYIVAQAPSRAQQYTQYNDILVSTVRPNLKNIAINKHTEPNLIASSGFCILRPERCAPEYLLYNVLSNEFTTKMISLTTGASYPAIRDNDVLNYTIPVPPLPLQNQFAEFVQKVEKAKEIVKIQIKDLQELLALKMDEYYK